MVNLLFSTNIPVTNASMWGLFFLVNDAYSINTRTNYNLVNFLSNTGGIASVMSLAFSFLSMKIQKILTLDFGMYLDKASRS